MAINCLANIVTKELCHNLLSDLTNLMGSSRAYIRKKAILCLYKTYLQ